MGSAALLQCGGLANHMARYSNRLVVGLCRIRHVMFRTARFAAQTVSQRRSLGFRLAGGLLRKARRPPTAIDVDSRLCRLVLCAGLDML